MKTIPPICPEPESGRKYWRSLDQLAETPEFREWAQREFPAGASEWEDPVSRRHFVKIMSASFLLAGLGMGASGCRRPEQRILPFAKMPENYVHGVPQYYASAMPTRGSAIPLVVKSNDGRPSKVEGNSSHPDSNGGTDRYAQASILNLYDPDRASRFTNGGNNASVEAVDDALKAIGIKFQKNGGEGLAFLVERNNSPSRARLQKQIADKMPQAGWYVYEPVDLDIGRRSASQAFGKPVTPHYKFEAAKTIVSLDCDFIGSEENAHTNIRGFSKKRHLESSKDEMSRLYIVESLMTLTGVNADHRLRVPAGSVAQFAAALAREILKQTDLASTNVPNLGSPAGAEPAFANQWVKECAQDLLQSRGKSLVLAGYRQPLAVHLLALALNAALGNVGKTVVYHEVPEAKEGTIAELASALNGGKVDTLVILNSNPVYTAPADLNWAATQRKAKTVVRLGYYEDETFASCDWHLPAAHYLESWGDALTLDGTLVPVQPLIAPLFDGITEIEVLALIVGANANKPYEIARETFASLHKGGDVEEAWKKYLHDGFLANSAAKPVEVSFNGKGLSEAISGLKTATPSASSLELIFHRDYSVDDGRYTNNGWLQEMPDPITKLVWDNVVLVSRKTAQELQVKNGDVVEVKVGNGSVRGPIWVQPGQADYSIGLALGYGRTKAGRVGHDVGFNVYPLRTSTAAYIATGATLQKTGETHVLACTQDHWSMEGRPIIREATHEQYEEHPDFASRMNMEEPPGGRVSLYPNPLEELKQKGLHQWGMSIDLNMCVGCQACMMACQSENNIPIVGKDQVKRGREMHWIRLDRYYSGPTNKQAKNETFQKEDQQQFQEWIDDPQVITQPMLCQHCEAAPCENVCPVNATVHDQEGLNLMVYNRCVGTRYCSNNCPYKVRRFNYFDFNKRPIGKDLYLGPLKKRPEEEYELTKMLKNPDVTVRMRGVMEKCTFCIQRIEGAKIAQKVKAGASGDVVVKTDSFTTACAQACPAGAIVFGNLNDPNSRVSKLKTLDRDYTVLEFLNTKPRLTYLAKVRNPNKQMPDYALQYEKGTLSFQNYEKHAGNPFEEKAEPTTSAAPEHAAEKGAR